MASDPAPASALEAKEQLSKELRTAWTRGSAESSPLALLVVAFDAPPTTLGTDILERALRVHCARARDVFIRRADNEYVTLLPDTPPAGARQVGGRIVEAMRSEDPDHRHRVSVGVAVVVPDEHRDPSELLRRAEGALQAAQDAGGDRAIGGSTAGSPTTASKKGALGQLRELLQGKKKDPDQKRHGD